MNGSTVPIVRWVSALLALAMLIGLAMAAAPVQSQPVLPACESCSGPLGIQYYEGFTLGPGDHKRYTFDLDSGKLIEYIVTVESGAEVQFLILDDEQYQIFKSAPETQTNLTKETASSGNPAEGSYPTDFSGIHHLVIYNPGPGSSTVEFGTNLDIFADLWELLTTVCMVCCGIIIIIAIIVAVVLLSGRKKGRGGSPGSNEDVSYSLDDMPTLERERMNEEAYSYERPSYDDEPYKRDSLFRRKR